jgi:hypothetical protein
VKSLEVITILILGPDLIYYCEKLEKEIGNPDFVVCLDSGCLNYDQLWVTTSLR